VPIQQRLARHDALARHTRHVGSAVFAIPPGARRDGCVGGGLFGY
jgi:deferrochelatase/peroxidase EfeB